MLTPPPQRAAPVTVCLAASAHPTWWSGVWTVSCLLTAAALGLLSLDLPSSWQPTSPQVSNTSNCGGREEMESGRRWKVGGGRRWKVGEVIAPPYISSCTSGDVTVAIGYDIRVYEGVNITVDCSSLVAAHSQGSIHWLAQPVNPRAVVRNSPEFPLPASSAQLVVPSTSIPNFLQVSFRCEVCTAQCWSNNSIISVVSKSPNTPLPSLYS